MSAVAGHQPAPELDGHVRSAPRSRQDRRWDRLRHVLALGWMVVAVTVVGWGERPASWQELQGLVAAGEVEAVRVTGELPIDARGFSVVELSWRHGLLAYRTEVVQYSAPSQRAKAATATDRDLPVLGYAPTGRLLTADPELAVTRATERSGGGELLGWRTPAGLGLVALGLLLGWLCVLVAGPAPWRATRWAWFWLGFPPFGLLAHLLLSGPTPGLPAPRDPERRLTGGWAFLVYVVVSAVVVAGPG